MVKVSVSELDIKENFHKEERFELRELTEYIRQGKTVCKRSEARKRMALRTNCHYRGNPAHYSGQGAQQTLEERGKRSWERP